jgi:hypothetical protein
MTTSAQVQSEGSGRPGLKDMVWVSRRREARLGGVCAVHSGRPRLGRDLNPVSLPQQPCVAGLVSEGCCRARVWPVACASSLQCSALNGSAPDTWPSGWLPAAPHRLRGSAPAVRGSLAESPRSDSGRRRSPERAQPVPESYAVRCARGECAVQVRCSYSSASCTEVMAPAPVDPAAWLQQHVWTSVPLRPPPPQPTSQRACAHVRVTRHVCTPSSLACSFARITS